MIEVDVRWTFVSKRILLWMHACMSWNGTSPNQCLFVTRLFLFPFVSILGAPSRGHCYLSIYLRLWLPRYGILGRSCSHVAIRQSQL